MAPAGVLLSCPRRKPRVWCSYRQEGRGQAGRWAGDRLEDNDITENSGADFRRQATSAYNAAKIVMVLIVPGCAWIGWWIGGAWGLVPGIVLGGVLTGCVWIAVSLLYVLSQDGG